MAHRDDRTGLVDQELPGFQIGDIFMSRTDERGIIRSANGTFQRLAGYDWSELLGAPHKVIRHPDMPRGVFQLFWDHLKNGSPIGAYVKNRASDGRHYWVFAIAMPVEGGYVSVRIKPSSALFGRVKDMYATLRTRERNEDLQPEDSAKALRAMLAETGYRTYSEFMADAIREEVESRRDALARRKDPLLTALRELKQAIDKIGEDIVSVRGMFEGIRGTPTNLRIQATRFGDVGVPIQIISQNYDLLTKEIEAANATMEKNFEDLRSVLDQDSFALAAVMVLHEAFRHFEKETDLPEEVSMTREAQILRPHTEGFRARGDTMLQRTEALVSNVRQLQRIVSGLAVTRVMCRIEAAGLTGDSGGIAEIINRLLTFQTSVMESIERIEGECRSANRTMERVVTLFQQPRDEEISQGAGERRKQPRAQSAA